MVVASMVAVTTTAAPSAAIWGGRHAAVIGVFGPAGWDTDDSTSRGSQHTAPVSETSGGGGGPTAMNCTAAAGWVLVCGGHIS